MSTETALIIAVIVALVIIYLTTSNDVTIVVTLDEDYPIKDDGVEELEVKSKRKYIKKAIPSKDVIVTRKPVGRPKKSIK